MTAPSTRTLKIALDAMGGDTAPETPVAGAVRAAREYPIEVVLIGDRAQLEPQLAGYSDRPSNISIVHAPQVIGMDEQPVMAVRRKKQSSINIGMELLREGTVDAFVSAGNTGAMVTAGTLILGLLPGVERPGIAGFLPGLKGDTLVIDVGANVDPKPLHLLQYGVLGAAYAHHVMEVPKPVVGLLNVGEEPGKGNEVTKQAFALLEEAGINFVGNAEGRDLFSGDYHVIVCDGFVGNVALKASESLAKTIGQILKRTLTKNWMTKLGAWLSRAAFQELRKEIDYTEYGGAPLLGVNGVCTIAHGSSNAKAIKNALRFAYESARHDCNRHLAEAIQKCPVAVPAPVSA